MSGLWDYDDDDDLNDLDTFNAPSPGAAVKDKEEEEEEDRGTRKRKPGRKAATAGPRSKRRAASPPTDLSLKKANPETVLLLSSDEDDDDDLLLLPDPTKPRGRKSCASGASTPAKPSGSARKKAAEAELDPATRQALAKEQELLSVLRQVTSMQQDLTKDDLDDLDDLEPVHNTSRLPPLGFTRLSSRLPSGMLGTATGLGPRTGCEEVGGLPAADVVGASGPSAAGTSYSKRGMSGGAEGEGNSAAEDRVRLKLAWNSGKDGYVMMRVVKTEPLSKMISKFREIARERNLSKDPNKIKFLFDGDDLAKTPTTTAEELDLEDDMMIDIKL